MSGGGVSSPQITPLKTPLVQAPQPAIKNPTAFTFPSFDFQDTRGFQNAQGGYTLTPSASSLSQVQGLSDTFQQGANAFGALGATVQPGFSLFRQTGLQNIENQRQSTQSNLQQNLAQRRVQGSSFADSAISNSNADFAQQSANFISQSYLQELSASQSLTQAQYQMQAQSYSALLQQSNLDTALAAQMSSTMGTTMASVAETQGQLDLSAAQTNAQGAIAQAQMQLQAQEFNAQLQASEMMGVGQLAGGLLGGGMGKSDIRVKRDIKQIGEWFNGLPVYLFRYIFDPRWFIGFMAQDVEKVMPEAVVEIGGIKHVNYRLAVL